MCALLKKILPIVALAPFYFILAVCAYWGVLAQYPAQIIKLKSYEPKIVAAGEYVHPVFDLTITRKCTFHVTRKLVNNRTTILIGFLEAAYEPTQTEFRSHIYIPRDIPPDNYQIQVDIFQACNPYDILFPKQIYQEPMKITVVEAPIKEMLTPKL